MLHSEGAHASVRFQGALQPFGSVSIIEVEDSPRRQKRRLTVEVEEMLVMADLGHVSGRHGVGGGDEAAQVGSPHFVGTQGVLLGFSVWRERAGLFCNNIFRNDKQSAFFAGWGGGGFPQAVLTESGNDEVMWFLNTKHTHQL